MAASEECVKEQWDEIPKVDGDKKSYRGLTLSNNMKVLLISDPETDKSAFALDVNIGYNCDPPDATGLAHLCEHMLFTASKKFEEEDFHQFLRRSGGKSNASTYLDHTLYHFEINPDELLFVLEDFCDLLVACYTANFRSENIKKHMSVMDQEHSVHWYDDTWRLAQVDKLFMKKDHPLKRVDLDSKALMKLEMKEIKEYKSTVLKFFQNYYSASVMSLCVFGKENLNDLQDIVASLFSMIPNYTVNIPKYDENPFPDDESKMKIHMKSLRDTHAIMLRFPLSLKHSTYYYPEIANYFSYLLESQDENTLLSVLKSKAWCNSLVSGKLTIAKNIISYFNITIDLTTIGLDHIDDIITHVFRYIAMLKEKGPLKTVFNECQKIVDMNLRYDDVKPLSYVISKAQEMQIHSFNKIVYVNRNVLTFEEWGKDLITEIMNCLSPQYVRIYIVSQLHTFAFKEQKTDEEYHIDYYREEISPKTIDNWTKSPKGKSCKDFQLPFMMTYFMATDFSIKEVPEGLQDVYPVIIRNEPLLRVWHKQNNEFLVPKTCIIIDFVSYGSYSADDTILKAVFVDLISDSFKSLPYASEVAGLKWQFFSSYTGVTLTISGYNDKQHLLVEHLLDHFVRYKVNGSSVRRLRFDAVTEAFKKVVQKYTKLNPYQYATVALTILLWDRFKIPMPEFYVKMDADVYICIENVHECLRDFLERLHVECFIYGNTTKEEALKISDTIFKKLNDINPAVNSPSSSDYTNMPREHKLDKPPKLRAIYNVPKKYLLIFRRACPHAARLILIYFHTNCAPFLVETELRSPEKSFFAEKILLVFNKKQRSIHDSNLIYYTISKQYNTSCVAVYYQDGIRRAEPNVMLDLLAQIISKPCQYILKTKKQLGYKVYSHAYKLNTTQGLKFVVVQNNTDNKSMTQNIEREIDVFINSIHTRISRMTSTEFNQHKKMLLASRQKTRDTFDAAAAMFWDEILTQQYIFDRITKEEKILNSLTKQNFQDYCKTFLHSTTKRKMSVYIIHLNEVDRLSKIGSKLEKWRDFRHPQFSYPLLMRDKYLNMDTNSTIKDVKTSLHSSTGNGKDKDDKKDDKGDAEGDTEGDSTEGDTEGDTEEDTEEDTEGDIEEYSDEYYEDKIF